MHVTPARHVALRDPERLAALCAAELPDPQAAARFERLTLLASRVAGSPAAVLCLVAGDGPVVLSQVMAGAAVQGSVVPLSAAFCESVLAAPGPIVIEDARDHSAVRDDPEMCALGIAACVAVPLVTGAGCAIGVLCVTDRAPRAWTAGEVGSLGDVAASVMTEIALRESETRHRRLLAVSPEAVLIHDGSRVRYANAAAARLFAAGRGDALVGRRVLAFIHPDDRRRVAAHVRQIRRTDAAVQLLEERMVRLDGSVIHTESAGVPIRYDGTDAVQVVLRDVTARRVATDAQAWLTDILEQSPDVIASSTPDGQLRYMNRAGRALLGLDETRPIEQVRVEHIQPQFGPGGAFEHVVAIAMRHGVWRGETTLRRRDGREMPVDQVLVAHRGDDGAVQSMSTILRDITERRQVEATLRSLALVDELTGLYNRRGFMAAADQVCRAARREGSALLALYLDMDDFKDVNDRFGHGEGDAALAAMAGVLRATFRESDVVGRQGGDEFTVIVAHGAEGAESIVRARLEEQLARYNASSGRPYRLAVSVGAAQAGVGSSASLADLIAEADAALYERKRIRKQFAGG